jgi:hypothetical protein
MEGGDGTGRNESLSGFFFLLTILHGLHSFTSTYSLSRPASFNSSQLKTCKMKSKIIVACIAATLVITFVSCGLFGSKKQTSAFNIEGQWTIDSIENRGTDSSNNMAAFLLGLVQKDSIPIGIEFYGDSSYQILHIADTVKGSYYLSGDRKSLFVKEDSAYTQLNFINRSDTSFAASTPDSIVYHLRKK